MFRKIIKQIQKLTQGSSERRHQHYRKGGDNHDRRDRIFFRDSSKKKRSQKSL